jgi:2-hydroxychromene-2-carboxylate isomerase
MGGKVVMNTIVEFYFDFGSPTAYLAHKRLQQLQERYRFDLVYKPILLGGLFKATGNTSPVMVAAKGNWMMTQDLPRFADLYQVPLLINPHFPINTLNLMRGAVGLLDSNCFQTYLDTVYDAIWVRGENMAEIDVVERVLTNVGMDARGILAMTQDSEVKARLISNTDAAVVRGCFGAPTMFVGDQMFFGQDRIQFIEMTLQ